jgi:pyruvate-ferredoxin/flavodoxin oxidoreductase
MQKQIIAHYLRFSVTDPSKVMRNSGMKGRINTVMRVCLFAIWFKEDSIPSQMTKA